MTDPAASPISTGSHLTGIGAMVLQPSGSPLPSGQAVTGRFGSAILQVAGPKLMIWFAAAAITQSEVNTKFGHETCKFRRWHHFTIDFTIEGLTKSLRIER